MKKLLLCVVAVLGLATANAQEKKETVKPGFEGKWWVQGNLSFADEGMQTITAPTGETGSYLGTKFAVGATVGTFVSQDVTLGLGLGIENYSPKEGDGNTVVKVTPLARKYWSVNDKFFIFGQADVPLGFFDGGMTYGVNLRPGVDYFVASNFSIEATFGQLGYNGFKPEKGDGDGNFGLNIDSSSLQFGLKYFF